MKRTVVFMAGLALTGGAAYAGAQEQSTTEEWDTDSSVVTQDEREDRTGMETDTQSQYETQSQTQQTDPYESQTQQTDPYETQTTDPYSTQSETQTQTDTSMQGSTAMQNPSVEELSQEELQGKTIVSSTGEEIGTIEKIGYSDQHQDKVAAVNVGGFLGVGEKVIAIPLSDLQMGADDNVTTMLDRTQIEQQQEIDPSMLSEEPSSTDPSQQY